MDVTLTAGAISTNLFAKTCKYLAEGVKKKNTHNSPLSSFSVGLSYQLIWSQCHLHERSV